MKVACEVCQTFVDVGPQAEPGEARAVVCDACRVAGRTAEVPGATVAAKRVPARVMASPAMQLDFDDAEPSRPRATPSKPAPPSDEPVSIYELQQLLAPGKEPPRWASATGGSGSSRPPAPLAAGDLGAADIAALEALCPPGVAAQAPPAHPARIAAHVEPAIAAPRDSSRGDLELMALLGATPRAAPVKPAVAATTDDSKMMDLQQIVAAHPAVRSAAAPVRADSAVIKLSGELFPSGTDAPATIETAASPERAATAEAANEASDETDEAEPAPPPPKERQRSWGWAAAAVVASVLAWIAAHPRDHREPPIDTNERGPSAASAAPADGPAQSAARTEASAGAPADSAIATTATAASASAEAATPRASAAPVATAAPRATAGGQRAALTSLTAAPTAIPLVNAPRIASAPAAVPAATTAASGAPPPAGAATAAPDAASASTDAPARAAPFDRNAAIAGLANATANAASCKGPYDPGGDARVSVTFAPTGRVKSSVVSGGSFAGTTTATCIANAFRSVTVPPFDGDPVTMVRTVALP